MPHINLKKNNFFLFSIILILLLKQFPTSSFLIEIKVNKEGFHQILSDEYELSRNELKISGTSSSLTTKYYNFPSTNTILKLERIKTFSDFSYMFNNLKNITYIKIKDISGKPINLSNMLSNCINLETFILESTDKKEHNIGNMENMFYNCYSLTSFSFDNFNLSNYKCEKKYSYYYEYYYFDCEYYYYISMSHMFYNCTKLQTIVVNSNKVQYISDTSYMFYNCTSLASINLANFILQNGLDLSYMFYNCYSLTSIKFKDSDIYLKDMKYMFYNCSKLNDIYYLNRFKSEYHLNMSYLFYNCQNLNAIALETKNFKITDAREMFYNCERLSSSFNFYPDTTPYSINMSRMFYNCNSIRSININNVNSYFYPNDISSMFYNCRSLVSLYIYKFKTTNIEKMSYLFYNCTKLTSFNILSIYFYNEKINDMRGIFQNCESIQTLNLTLFYTPYVEIMWDMFNGCKSLTNLIIPNFDTSKVTDMKSMFSGCSSLTTLNLNHFNTKNVQYMNEMFNNCENLRELNMSQLTTDSLGSMYRMFYNCHNLIYLNLFNLVEDVQSITEMFEKVSNDFIICIKDKNNIPNIYNLIVNKISRDCSKDCYGEERKSTQNKKSCCALDEYEYEGECYIKCPSKTKHQNSTNLCENFTCDNSYYNYEQDDCIDNITDGYYINDTYLNTIDKCHEDCKTCYNGSDEYSTNCLSCNDNESYVYLGNCYKSCRYGDFNESDGIKKCLCHRKKCKECSRESLKYDLCISCNEDEGYYEKYYDNNNIYNFTNCYKEPEGYYLNSTEKKHMPCYPSCKFCYPLNPDKMNHYCRSCNEENSYSILDENNSTYMSCYPECKYNYFFNESDDNNYTCAETQDCPQEYPYLLENTKRCIESCNNKTQYLFRHTRFKDYPEESKNCTLEGNYYNCSASCPFERPFEMTKTQYCVSNCTIMERYNKLCFTNYEGNKSSEVQDMVLNDFKDDIVDTFNYTFIINESLIHEEINNIYEITSTNITYQDRRTTFLNLSECEPVLKSYYGIDINESLYIFKVDAYVEGKTGPNVEYEIYYHFDTKKLNQLDLSICEGKEILIGYPVDISENELDSYNSSSDYYNDVCYTYTNSKGTDVTLNDRQMEYINNNKRYCDENCEFSKYDIVNKRLICSCNIKYSISMISGIKIDKNKLYDFIDLKQIVNFNIMKCFNLIFSIEIFKNNIGFYSFFPTIIAFFVALFILWFKEFKTIKTQVKEIILAKKFGGNANNKSTESEINSEKKIIEKDEQNSVNSLISNSEHLSTIKEETISENNEKIYNSNNYLKGKGKKSLNVFLIGEQYEIVNNSKLVKKYKKKNVESVRFIPIQISMRENKFVKKRIDNEYVLKFNKNKNEELIEKQKLKISESLKYNDNELNNLGYKKAFLYDKRTFLQYYLSLLFTKHILFQIFNKKDYNSNSIKVLLFFFNFSSSYAINALFFNDNTMHQIYEDEGDFNFIYQLPQIVYSTLISYFIDNITAYLALSEDDIIELKQDKNLENLIQKGKNVIGKLKIKFILFFIINFIFILLFWYYLSCYCAVYKNSQYHLLKDTLISLSIGYITPFGTNLIVALIRINSLKTYTKGNRILFILSRFLQNFL